MWSIAGFVRHKVIVWVLLESLVVLYFLKGGSGSS